MCVQSIAPITLGKPALAANCALMLACSTALYGNLMYLDDIRMIPSHTAGMARLRVDWHNPDRSARSRWNAPVARNPSVVSTCVGTDNPWLLAVVRSSATSAPSVHHLQGPLTTLTLPSLIPCSSSHCACFYIHPYNCKHGGCVNCS